MFQFVSVILLAFFITFSLQQDDPEMAEALRKSAKDMSTRENIFKEHHKRILKILNCNGLELIEIPHDGNCLFTESNQIC